MVVCSNIIFSVQGEDVVCSNIIFSVQGEDGSMFKHHLDHLRIRIQVAEKQSQHSPVIQEDCQHSTETTADAEDASSETLPDILPEQEVQSQSSHQRSQYLDLNRNHWNYKHKKDLHCESIHDETVGHQIGSFQVIKI